jgi:hypothetical protein
VHRFLVLILLAPSLALFAADRWIRIQSGPFEVLSNDGEKSAREVMVEAEQFRWTFGQLLGIDDPKTRWPVRIVLVKNRRAEVPGAIAMGRDSWISAGAGSPQWRKALTRILLDDNTGRMPAGIENGLIALFSTLEIKGVRITLGNPPPPAEQTKDWARLHFLVTSPELATRSRVMLANLAHGADYDTACRNAFEKRGAEMDILVDSYFAAGRFEPVVLSGRAMSERDFTVREIESYDGNIALADLLLADPTQAAAAGAAYKALTGPEATEGLALLAARRDPEAAAKLFQTATAAGSKNPRAWLGTGERAGAVRAIELNPKWPDPHIRLAELGAAPNVKAAELMKAAALALRDSALWQRAALACEDANQFPEASKAWSGAERAAASDEERKRLRQARIDSERRRADFEAAERKRIADEQARDLERVRQESMAAIRAAEEKANKEMAVGGSVPKNPQPWWDGPEGPLEKAVGTLRRVDCLAAGKARLVVETGPTKTIQLLIPDPGKLVLRGGGDLSLGCGLQQPARRVAIEYTPARDAKLGTAGNVQTLELH